ncbi:MAG: TonB family protein [Marivita sp.]|uniref:energy transducer TonB n=1 Tax=Marivita sp. TaxID=2003365 RepID=UPI0025C583F4|nr:TonB family protein [Marivita sp.]MCI5109317.1 TonB family protein [Marivita sp.]
MRVFEIVGFIALSGALHAATLAIAPMPGGGSSGGEGGTADVTLQAASPTLAAMVQDWERPPEVSAAPDLAPPTIGSEPERPSADARSELRPPQMALAAPSAAPDRPEADTRLPAPPVPLAAPAPDDLPVPEMRNTDLPEVPRAHAAPKRALPQLAAPTDDAQSAPRLDTTPAESRTAPTTSLRPAPRPKRVAAQPARTPDTVSRPAQTAKGGGAAPSTAPAAPRAAPAATGPSKAQLARLEQQWGAQISSALRRAHRPPRGVAGSVTLVISIAPSGRVAGVALAASSGNSRLDQAALAAVKRARFPRAPEGLTQSSYRFSQRLTVAR